jgi:hypothetical protein
VYWYGERGIINSLVVELASRQAFQELLSQVKWADENTPAWIGSVRRVTPIVEVGLNDFGAPDLSLVCDTDNQGRHVVFIEAKIKPYLAEAASNSEAMGPGENSDINRQLMLKYRCSIALAGWRGAGPVVEPDDLYAVYARPPAQGGAGDPTQRPRRVGRHEILEQIIRPLGIGELPLAHYHFVALTWDREPFFQQALVAADLFPLLLTRTGENAWEANKGRVGWIGYAAIEERLRPGIDYVRARATMMATAAPDENTLPQTFAGMSRVPQFNIRSRFAASPLITLLGRLEEVARRFWPGRVKRGPGSTSITYPRRVTIKFMPQNPGPDEHILLGLSTLLSPQEWCPHTLAGPQLAGSADKVQPFYTLRLPSPPQDDEAVRIVEEVFRVLAEREGARGA